jgi:protoheme IX farnesyltransferase
MISSKTIKSYYNLAKPGIIYGNLLTAAAGFLFASHWHSSYSLFVSMLAGTALIIGSGCVFNNVIDRDIDKKMERTKKRATVTGQIPLNDALIYGAVLGVIGCLILGIFVNVLALVVAIAGFVIYVVIYGAAKRKSVYGTMVGSLAGAIPPLIGYTAVTKNIDQAGLILVFILICWQLTHFYAISLYRKKDYVAAGIPVWPIIKGDWSAQLQAIGFIGLFTIFSVSLFFLGYTGYIYLAASFVLGIGWLWYSVVIAGKLTASAWGRKVFVSSLIVILAISVLLAVGPVMR